MPTKLTTKKLLQLQDVQQILSTCAEKPRKWRRFREFKEKLVISRRKKLIRKGVGEYWDTETIKVLCEKEEPVFKYDSLLARRLSELVDAGIMQKKLGEKRDAYYRPSRDYQIESIRSSDIMTLRSYRIKDVVYIVPGEIMVYGLGGLEKNTQTEIDNILSEISVCASKIQTILGKSKTHSSISLVVHIFPPLPEELEGFEGKLESELIR